MNKTQQHPPGHGRDLCHCGSTKRKSHLTCIPCANSFIQAVGPHRLDPRAFSQALIAHAASRSQGPQAPTRSSS